VGIERRRRIARQFNTITPHLSCASLLACAWVLCRNSNFTYVHTGNPKECRSVLSWLLALNTMLFVCHLQMPTNSLLNLFLIAAPVQGLPKSAYHFSCFIDIWENFVHLGYPPSCQWLCPRNQWPGHTLFCGVFVCVCRYVYTQKARDTLLLHMNGSSHKCHSAQTPICNHFTCNHLSKIPKSLSQSSTPFGSFFPWMDWKYCTFYLFILCIF